ncbi:MAG TPA: hypothetical protein PLC74_08985, partial [Acetobacteraceae bacterium]|nr:hypothetical protein [Acetobacteraceae bacterium]
IVLVGDSVFMGCYRYSQYYDQIVHEEAKTSRSRVRIRLRCHRIGISLRPAGCCEITDKILILKEIA